MGEPYPEEAPRRGGGLKWMVATGALCAAFWIGLYFVSLQPLQEDLGRLRAAQAAAEAELPTAQAERQLAAAERDLAALEKRWETTATAELVRHLEAHSITLLSAKPGEEAGTFILEVEGSAHGLGQALPEIEKAATAGRLPGVLYLRRVKQDQRLRARFRLEGVGRISDWTLAPPPAEGKP